MPVDAPIASLYAPAASAGGPTPFEPGLRAPSPPGILTPAWRPIVLPGACAPFGLPHFQPVVVEALAVAIVGGPSALHVAEIYDRQRLWFTIPARVRIAGFAVHEGILYVQDGPVLASYSLAGESLDSAPCTQFCVAAINLVARVTAPVAQFVGWTRERGSFTTGPSGTKFSGTHVGALDDAVLADLHALPPDAAARQQALVEARLLEQWACLSEAYPPRYVRGGDAQWAGELAGILNVIMRVSWDEEDEDRLAGAKHVHAELAQAEAAAADLVFSAPVVRQHQLAGKPGGMVFALAANGTLHALDNALTMTGAASFARPARPVLAIAEQQASSSSNYGCWLFYPTADGGIKGVNGAAFPPTDLAQWDGTGPVDPRAVMPLAYTDGLLWGGGVLGGGFFALPPSPMMGGAVLDVPPPGGPWRDYELRTAEKLALVSDGGTTRLLSYAPQAKTRDRWAPHHPPGAAWTRFWKDAGRDADPAQPVLVLEGDVLGSPNAGLRAYVAATDEPAHPEFASRFPAPPQAIGSATFDPGSYAGVMPRIAWVPARPAIERGTLYALARSAGPGDQAAHLLGLPFPGDIFILPVGMRRRALLATPFPADDGVCALVAFSLASLADNWKAAAVAEGQRLAWLAQPLLVQVTTEVVEHVTYYPDPHFPPFPAPAPMDFYTSQRPVGKVTVTTVIGTAPQALSCDWYGQAWLDSARAGETAQLDADALKAWDWRGGSVTVTPVPVTLVLGATNVLHAQVRVERTEAAWPPGIGV